MSERKGTPQHDGNVAVELDKPKLKRPPMFKVVMYNDDYTPMDFVVEVLMRFFHMNEEKASQTMLMVHTQGKATCGVYTADVAETKVAQVVSYANQQQHPLQCGMEEA
ncbi:MAG: ATP-dependent Clp protease adapter ClpS [Kangiellaceae bacterium]|jgi:ATP-dependent Clp protease adaptor protein ClpS|nr:ATP-dependent Clp protease adapter ClpS [Kangiellaceae bacterium]|tara:strand:- start:2808 stop:3131 length:324 start_codon:yes stop_codon:yes gene_type:complete